MKKSKGFTLIELMIVVAIIGVLAAIAIPKFADLIRKSNEGATKGNLGSFRSAMSIYYGDNEGVYPGNLVADLTATQVRACMLMDGGKYLDAIPTCFTPPYHPKALDTTAGGNLEVTIANVTDGTNGGAWGYQDDYTPAAGDKKWGEIWVNCSHTDTKNGTWSSY